MEYILWSLIVVSVAGIVVYHYKPEWIDNIVSRFKSELSIGSDEKPGLTTNKKNGRVGKGSRPRPGYYSQQYKDNYDKIFGKSFRCW